MQFDFGENWLEFSQHALTPEKAALAKHDIVDSWGVLRHTGDMKKAVQNTALLVRPGGHLILALYNRHWTSPVWLIVKWLYCKSPPIIKKLLVTALYPIIYVAKLLPAKILKNNQEEWIFTIA